MFEELMVEVRASVVLRPTAIDLEPRLKLVVGFRFRKSRNANKFPLNHGSDGMSHRNSEHKYTLHTLYVKTLLVLSVKFHHIWMNCLMAENT